MIDRRKPSAKEKGSDLPVDFLNMVTEVFSNNFDSGLKRLEKIHQRESFFIAQGNVYPSEIILAVSLTQKDKVIATTVYGSVDFDPKASAPSAEELLSACVDGIASVFDFLFSAKHPKRIEQMADESLSALEDVPFEWASYNVGKRTVFLRIDKANIALDEMATDWLKKHDPNFAQREEEERKKTEALFVTGEKIKNKPDRLH